MISMGIPRLHRNFQYVPDFNRQILGSVTQRIVLVATYTLFSLSCLFSVIVTTGLLTGLSPFIGVPLLGITVLIGGTSFYIAQNYINLNAPEVCQKIQSNIEGEFRDFELQYRQDTLNHLRHNVAHFLEEIADKYGWEAMFVYQLPPPQLFAEIFRFQARFLSINEVINLYEIVHKEYEAAKEKYGDTVRLYEIPNPSDFKEKWRNEIIKEDEQHIWITQLLDVKLIEKLALYTIISEEEKQFLKEAQKTYAAANAVFHGEVKDSSEAFQKAIAPEKAKFEKAMRRIDFEYKSASVHAHLRGLRKKQLRHEADYKRLKDTNPALLRKRKEYDNLKRSVDSTVRRGGTSASHITVQRYLQQVEADLEAIRRQLDQKYQPQFEQVKKQYDKLCTPLFQELKQLEQTRENERKLVQAEYEKKTLLSRQRYEVLTAEPKKRLLDVLQRIQNQYFIQFMREEAAS